MNNGSAPETDGEMAVSMRAVEQEKLSPEACLEVLETRRGQIERSTFVPPDVGDSHFGYFRVDYKKPIHRSVNHS